MRLIMDEIADMKLSGQIQNCAVVIDIGDKVFESYTDGHEEFLKKHKKESKFEHKDPSTPEVQREVPEQVSTSSLPSAPSFRK